VKPEVADMPPDEADVVIEPLASLPNVRRAVDVLRLVLALAVCLWACWSRPSRTEECAAPSGGCWTPS
jgi:hypothetical protein